MKKLATLSLVLLLTTSCIGQWGKRIKGNGDLTTVERSVGEYDGISLSGWFDVEIIEGKEGTITIEGESNLLEYIVTEVKKGKLMLKVQKGYNLKPSSWDNGIRITVPVESINSVALSGSGDIVGKTIIKANEFKTAMSGSGDIEITLDADSVDAAMSGSGDITLKGNTTDFKAVISGSGDIKAYDLQADNVTATISGSADIKVTANKMLQARVSGSGDISYRGNPTK